MKWIKIISQFIFFVGVIFLLAFTNTQNSDRICIDYRINIDNETTSLVTRSEIIKLMESIKESIVGTNVNKVPIYEIEQKIESLNNIQNAEVYINMQGILFVELIQKKPIVRVSPKYILIVFGALKLFKFILKKIKK